jgi:hypothetical protein
MIVDAAVLADVPAKSHAFEHIVAENEIASVVALGKKAIRVERLGADGVANDVVLDILQREVALRDAGEALDPIGDVELLG